MNKQRIFWLLLIPALLLAPWWGARQTLSATEQERQASPLMVNFAYWSLVLPGYGYMVDLPRTQLAVLWQQTRDGAEFADMADLQQRAHRFLERMESWLEAPLSGTASAAAAHAPASAASVAASSAAETASAPASAPASASAPVSVAASAAAPASLPASTPAPAPAIGQPVAVDHVLVQAKNEALRLLVRLPWQDPAQAALAQKLGDDIAHALPAWGAPAQISPAEALHAFAAAHNLAMLAARRHDAAALQHYSALALQLLPAPQDIKAHTRENTARHLLPLHTALASCAPQQAPLGLDAAQAALQHGYDIRQLRQQYTASFDQALLLWAQHPQAPAECHTLAAQYKQLLTATPAAQ